MQAHASFQNFNFVILNIEAAEWDFEGVRAWRKVGAPKQGGSMLPHFYADEKCKVDTSWTIVKLLISLSPFFSKWKT